MVFGKTLDHIVATTASSPNGETYAFEMLGSDPQRKRVATTIPSVAIALRVHFPNGITLDPTQRGCRDSASICDRFF